MGHEERTSSGGGAIVAAILIALALIVLAVVIVAGVGIGFFWVARSEMVMLPPTAVATASAPAIALPSYVLTDQDAKDHLEAPAIVATPNGYVLVAYASQEHESGRVLRIGRLKVGIDELSEELLDFRTVPSFSNVSQTKEGQEVKRPVRVLPQLASGGGKVFLGWLEPNAEGTSIHYVVAESSDDGLTWSEPLRVHESDGASPNFIALAADEQGNVAASWLDNRAGVKQPFAAVKLAGEAKFQPESQVYASPNESGVCPCCPTAVAISPQGEVFVAFRNQLEGYRDIYVASRKLAAGSEFGAAVSVVAQPTWKFDGCPHDGPSLAIDGQQVVVAWIDASSGQTRCYLASRSLVGEGAFSAPSPLDGQATTSPQANPRLTQRHGTIFAAWEQSLEIGVDATTEGAEASVAPQEHSLTGIRLIHCRTLNGPATVLSPFVDASQFQTRPAVALDAAGNAFVTFAEQSEHGKQIRVERAPASAFGGPPSVSPAVSP